MRASAGVYPSLALAKASRKKNNRNVPEIRSLFPREYPVERERNWHFHWARLLTAIRGSRAVTPLPPGPKGHWLTGNLADFRADRLGFVTRIPKEHGDLVALRFAHYRLFLVSHPELIEQVLVHQAKHFIKHFALRLNPLLLGKGLLTSEGDFWLKHRRLIQPAFNKNRLAEYAPVMTAAVDRHLRTWQAGQRREIQAEMMAITLEIAAQTMFGAAAAADAQEVRLALDELQQNFIVRFNSIVQLPLWLPTPLNLRMRRAVRRLDAILYRFIQERRRGGGEKHDLLSLLLRARDEDDGSGMSDQQVRDEAMTLFLAGHETTALALAWTWYLLAQHPHVEEQFFQEVHAVVGQRWPTLDDVPKLKFTEAVVLEGMRLYPPAYIIGREAVDELILGGFRVPRGMTLFMSPWSVQRDERFFKQPLEFRPQRWREESIKQLPKFAYFPFGGGPRLCVGNSFAMTEMILVLAAVAQRFRFTLIPGQVVIPQPTFTLRPHPGIAATITPRA